MFSFRAHYCNGENTSITLFGDDITTEVKEGFNENEQIYFRLLHIHTGNEIAISITYENRFDGSGLFHTNGLSVVKEIILTSIPSFMGAGPQIKIYPNPSSGIFNIEGEEVHVTITVLDAFGQKLITFRKRLPGTIDLTSLSKGVYFITLENEKGINFTKVVIQ